MSRTPRLRGHLNKAQQLERGQRMLALREDEGLNNIELSERFGFGRSSVSKWIRMALEERGKK